MGNGRIYFNTGLNRYIIDISATAVYDAHADESLWRKSFELASKYLFDATKGQMQLGSVGFLNYGTKSGSEDDAFLNTDTVHSSSNYTKFRVPDSEVFSGDMWLTQIAMVEPLEITHELGHYVIGLGDEYYSTIPLCTHNANSGGCIMEFAATHGVHLNPDGTTSPPAKPPVTEYCYPAGEASAPSDLKHMNCDGDVPCLTAAAILSQQHCNHMQSCWETIQKHFTKIVPPWGVGLPSNTHQPVQWIVRSHFKKFELSCFGLWAAHGADFTTGLLGGLVAWLRVLSAERDHVALTVANESSSFVRDMHPIDSQDLEQVVESLRAFADGNSDKKLKFLSTDQFAPNKIGAAQYLVMVVPGDFLESEASEASFWRAINSVFADRRISLVVIVLGYGSLAKALASVVESSSRLELVSVIPHPSYRLSQVRLQSALLDTYVATSSRFGVVESQAGSLPANSIAKLLAVDSTPEKLMLESQHEGLDVPAYIEKGSTSALFGLIQGSAGELDLKLIPPASFGGVANADYSQENAISRPDETLQLQRFKGDVSGRWILRVRRVKGDGDLPFHLVTLSENNSIDLNASVFVNAQEVRFESRVFFENQPLDFVESRVDIVRAEDYLADVQPLMSLVLYRERLIDPLNSRQYTVSTGSFSNTAEFPAGSYVAVFRTSNVGRSIRANNLSGQLFAQSRVDGQTEIPVFSRLACKHFVVTRSDTSHLQRG